MLISPSLLRSAAEMYPVWPIFLPKMPPIVDRSTMSVLQSPLTSAFSFCVNPMINAPLLPVLNSHGLAGHPLVIGVAYPPMMYIPLESMLPGSTEKVTRSVAPIGTVMLWLPRSMPHNNRPPTGTSPPESYIPLFCVICVPLSQTMLSLTSRTPLAFPSTYLILASLFNVLPIVGVGPWIIESP